MSKRLEFIVLTVVALGFLGFLAWLGVSVADMKAGEGEMRVDLRYTKSRLDRIVDQLPTLRREIAQYQAHAPARAVIVTTRPVRRDSTTSVAVIHLLALDDRTLTSHYITLSQYEAPLFDSYVAGVVTSSAPAALSFSNITGLYG